MGLTKGQVRLIELLYKENYNQLSIYALNALYDKPLAEEVVQETFRIACEKADNLLLSKNQEGWLEKLSSQGITLFLLFFALNLPLLDGIANSEKVHWQMRY